MRRNRPSQSNEGSPLLRGVNRALEFTEQWPNALGIGDEMRAGAAYVGQGAMNLARRATGRDIEIPAGVAAQAAADEERANYDRFRRERPGQNAAATTMGILAGVGAPAATVPRLSMLQAGTAAAGINAPFAVARQEGNLQERLPGAAQETALAFGLGAGLQGAANWLTRAPRPNGGRSRAADFAAAGVRPTMAAVAQGAPAGATRMVAENFIAGAPARARLQASLDDTARAAGDLAARAGEQAPREVVGERVQSAVRNFSRNRNAPNPRPGTDARSVPVGEWTLPAKANALYDDVFGRLAADEAAMVGQVDGPLLSVESTQRTIEQIRNRVSGPASREAMASPMIERMAQALGDDAAAGALRFQDLRQWRTWVREAQRNEGLRQGMDNAALQRLEAALTEDIYASAMMIGGRAADDLRVIDRWYRRNVTMIDNALEQFAQGGGAQAYRRMIDLASQGGRQNSRQLQQALRVLPNDVRRSVSASIIGELGNPSFGAPNVLEPGAFSVERFVTNYARLSNEGREALFGPLVKDMDTLARVAGAQKGVEALANRSRSGVNAQNFGTAVALLNPSSTGWAITGLAGGALLGEMLTNPVFVRWLASSPRAGASVGGMRQHLSALARIASRDPALTPYYEALAQQLGAPLPVQEPSSASRRARPERRTEQSLAN